LHLGNSNLSLPRRSSGGRLERMLDVSARNASGIILPFSRLSMAF
jgi:hypothetical protein